LPANATADFVHLRGGLVVPADAYRLLLHLEGRGIALEADRDDLLVGPSSRLTDTDRAAIRRWKPHLLLLVRYVPPASPEELVS
jgi:hypothetical protein